VILHKETAGDDSAGREVQRTDLKVIHILALAALEVIVMTHPGALVAGLPIGEDHGLDALPLQQQVQRPVNSRNPKAAQRRLGSLEDLLDRDRPLGIRDGEEDRIALAGMTLAERGGHGSKLTAIPASTQGKRQFHPPSTQSFSHGVGPDGLPEISRGRKAPG